MTFAIRCRCVNCDGVKDDAPFGARFENSFESRRFCSECGHSEGWYDSRERWVATDVWWKPWTWFDGYWEKVPQ